MTTTKELALAVQADSTLGDAIFKDHFCIFHFKAIDSFQARYVFDDVIRMTLGTSSTPAEVMAKNFKEWLDSNPFVD